jgi:hypothetical protein
MKTNFKPYLSILAIFFAFVMVSCEGPEGPIGPQGETGATGATGANGTDASLYCATCHNTAKNTLLKSQLATNLHGNGPTYVRATSKTCAKCHSHEGFLETIATGRDTTASALLAPTGFKCQTCHESHVSMNPADGTDYALRQLEPVRMMFDSLGTTKLDFNGTTNTCAYCHQPRPGQGFPVKVENTSKLYAVTSTRWGPHYSGQSTVLIGKWGYEVPGSKAYGNSKHSADKDCAFCHMVKEPKNAAFGGHTFAVDEETCNTCHNGKVNMEALRTDFDTKVALLRDKLIAKKLITTSGTNATHTSAGVLIPASATKLGRAWTNEEAGAVFNYRYLTEDRSRSIHNPKYVDALLTNTIEMVDRW